MSKASAAWGAVGLSLSLVIGDASRGASDERESSPVVRLGMSTALSGASADLGTEMKRGIELGLASAGDDDPAAATRFELIALDDGYEPSRTAANMRALVEREAVIAIVGNVGTPTAIASLPIVREHGVLFFAPFTGAGVLRSSPPERHVVNLRASYSEEIEAMIRAIVDEGGAPPESVAFFTQRDGYGDSGLRAGVESLARRGLEDSSRLVHTRYERNTVAVERAVAALILEKTPPRAVIMVGSYLPCATFVNLARRHGIEAPFLSVSFVGSESLARHLDPGVADVFVTQVVPHPVHSGSSIAREFRAALAAQSPAAAPTFTAFEGFVAARTLALAVRRADRRLDRDSIIDALESLGRFDVGLGIDLELSKTEHQASHHVFATEIRRGEILPIEFARISERIADA
jgi:branched-chain amino acid transport system substrate-binding protein